MKLWVVTRDADDWDELIGVFASKDGADRAMKDDIRDYHPGTSLENYSVIETVLQD